MIKYGVGRDGTMLGMHHGKRVTLCITFLKPTRRTKRANIHTGYRNSQGAMPALHLAGEEFFEGPSADEVDVINDIVIGHRPPGVKQYLVVLGKGSCQYFARVFPLVEKLVQYSSVAVLESEGLPQHL